MRGADFYLPSIRQAGKKTDLRKVIRDNSLVVVTRIVRACKEPVKRSCSTFDAFLAIALRPLVVRTLFLLLFSLTLGVGILILCDLKLRMIFRCLVTNRNAAPDWFCMDRSNGFWKR